MHTLYTTEAFILASYPHGEHSRAYKLFTRSHGLLYAHGQGVRELRNRNRFALRTHGLAGVTLVRGRDVWRITGARCVDTTESSPAAYMQAISWRRTLALVGRILPIEDPAPQIFDILRTAQTAVGELDKEYARTQEALTVLRILNELGYVARPHDTFVADALTPGALQIDVLHAHRRDLIRVINAALQDLPR